MTGWGQAFGQGRRVVSRARGGLIAVGVVAIGGTVTAALLARRLGFGSPGQRRHTITVDVAMDRLTGGGAPPPLRYLSEHADVTLHAAPGGRGTEIHASPLRDGSTFDIRQELRKTKQILEVGEVLRLDPRSSGRRGPLSKRVTQLMDRALAKGCVS